jgi:RimJ/RimL family protein N-acetyltransferase
MEHILKNITLPDDNNLIISKATVADAAPIIAFLNKVAGETDFLTFGLNQFPLSVAEEEQIISECLTQSLGLMLIGKIDHVIVSQLFLQRSNKTRLQHSADFGITVSKKYWRKSIGQQMILTAIEWAAQNNIIKLQLKVRSDNERAIRLYQKLGFVVEGKIAQSIKVANFYFDEYIMGLSLQQKS